MGSHNKKATLSTTKNSSSCILQHIMILVPMQMGPNSILKRSTINKTHYLYCSFSIMHHMPRILQLSHECCFEDFLSLVLWTCGTTNVVIKCASHPCHAYVMASRLSTRHDNLACVISRRGTALLHNNFKFLMFTLFKLVYKVGKVNIKSRYILHVTNPLAKE